MSKNKKGAAFLEGSSWFHRVKILQEDGTIKYSKRGGFASAEEAEKSYRIYEDEFQKASRIYQMTKGINPDIELKDYLVYWFENVYSERVENTTRMVAAYTLYDLILPHMEQDIKLKYLNAEYLDSLLEKASKACVSAGNKSREFLSIALKDAVIQGYIKWNPINGTRPYKRKKPSVTILSKEKIKVLLKASAQSSWYLEILLALFCGLRKGEIQGLKFSDFDFDENIVKIERQITTNPITEKGGSKVISYEVVEKPPKTENSCRILRVPDIIMQELRIRQKRMEDNRLKWGDEYNNNDYISCQDNGMPHTATAFNNALTKICSRNGLPHVTPHGLRHMYATILLEQNVALVKVSALLGHASVNTTFEYYCEQMDENSKIIAFLNNHFLPEGSD